MKCDELQVILSYDLTWAERIWKCLEEYFKRKEIKMSEFTLRKDSFNSSKKKKHFGFESDTLKISFANVYNGNHGLLWVVKKDINNIKFDFDEFLYFLVSKEKIIQLFLTNKIYKSWQNTENVDTYKLNYGDSAHLKLIDNGLPYPLNEKIIDISNNPGRRIIKDGYVEAVAGTMWLGNEFWNRVNTKKEYLNKLDFITIEDINDDTIKITTNVECFIDESTKDIQNKLRKTLYFEG